MANVLLNFAAGSSYEKKRRINSQTGKYIARFDRIIEYTIDDIDDFFKASNIEIFKEKKGLGLWLWKPYFINKALSLLDNDDLLFYCDSSSVFIRPIKGLVRFMESENIDIMPFVLPFKELNWSSEGVMNYFGLNADQRESNQLCASFLALKKTKHSSKIIEDWLLQCQDYKLLSGKFSNAESLKLIEHRYDQSILSMIIKKRGIKMYKDPSQYGNFPQLYGKHYDIDLDELPKGDYKTSIVLIRRGSFLRACLNYFFNMIIYKFKNVK